MNNNKTIISFYYQHTREELTEHRYRAYLALAQRGYKVHYFSVPPLSSRTSEYPPPFNQCENTMLTSPSLVSTHNCAVSLQNMFNSFILSESIRTDITEKTASCRQRYGFEWEARLLGFVEGSEDQESRLAQRILFAKYQAGG